MTAIKRQAVKHDLARKHVTALAALNIHPGYLPVDGLCLEELHHWGLIHPVPRGYALTVEGDAALAAERALSAHQVRAASWQRPMETAGSGHHAAE